MCPLWDFSQESMELRHHQQSLNKSPSAANAMLEKLQQRVKDRDAALEVRTGCSNVFFPVFP